MYHKLEFTLCRLCLCSGDCLMDIFEDNNKPEFMVEKAIEDVLQLKVVKESDFPWLVCSTCLEKLSEFRLFKRRCVESQFVFYNRVQKGRIEVRDWKIGREKVKRRHKVESESGDHGGTEADTQEEATDDDGMLSCERESVWHGCGASEIIVPSDPAPKDESDASISEGSGVDSSAAVGFEGMEIEVNIKEEEESADLAERLTREDISGRQSSGKNGSRGPKVCDDTSISSEASAEGVYVGAHLPPEVTSVVRGEESVEDQSQGQQASTSHRIEARLRPMNRHGDADLFSCTVSFTDFGTRDEDERHKNFVHRGLNMFENPTGGQEDNKDDVGLMGNKVVEVNPCTAASRVGAQQQTSRKESSTNSLEEEEVGSGAKGSEGEKPTGEFENEIIPSEECETPNVTEDVPGGGGFGSELLGGSAGESSSEASGETLGSKVDAGATASRRGSWSCVCHLCGGRFSRFQHLRKHMYTKHLGVKRDSSSRTFADRGDSSGGKESSLSCDVCSKTFSEGHLLNRHMLRHKNVQSPHTCPTCLKSFSSSTALRIHTYIHTGERPYSCDTCGKTFSQQGTLSRHTMLHTGQRPHACATCPKAFMTRMVLLEHMRTHTGERPHSCDICNKSFGTKGCLKVHLRSHTGVKPHLCSLCPKAFTRKSNLRAHLRSLHSEKVTSLDQGQGGKDGQN